MLYQVKEWKCIVEKYFINQITFKVNLLWLPHTQPSSPSDFTSAMFLATKILERGQLVDYEM